MVGRPSASDFEHMVCGNMLKIFPVSVSDIRNAHKGFGPDVGSLRSKTVRRRTDTVVSDYLAIFEEIK